MGKNNHLTKRQHLVIEALITTDRNEQEILDEHKVGRATFEKWLAEPAFLAQFDLRSKTAHRRSTALIAHHAPQAAMSLVNLAKDGTGETTRKACLDIISMSKPADSQLQAPVQDEPAEPSGHPPISPDTATRLLAVLAEEQHGVENDQ